MHDVVEVLALLMTVIYTAFERDSIERESPTPCWFLVCRRRSVTRLHHFSRNHHFRLVHFNRSATRKVIRRHSFLVPLYLARRSAEGRLLGPFLDPSPTASSLISN